MTSKKSKDRVFDSDVMQFDRNIYASGKGKIREAVLHADLRFLIQHPSPLRVLDIGGGLGQLNREFARAGHSVVHTDLSAEMVEAARQRHTDEGLVAHYEYHVAGLQNLDAVLADQTFDIVLCHAVLEWLAEPFAALASIQKWVRPAGWLSLMFYNLHAKRMANMVYGNFDYVTNNLQVRKKVRFSPNQPLDPNSVIQRMEQFPLSLYAHSGVRCFHDYLRPAEFNLAQLIPLELAYRQQEPYRALGRYQHLLYKKESS
ncbi:methyltransferase domain-containing protein [Aliidiomarina sanyensis]|nr:methyltransferase domain-containing protein [Aliidiomarina sanyensis]